MVYCFGYWCGDMHTLLSETVGENFILIFEQMNNDIMFTQETTDDRKWLKVKERELCWINYFTCTM